VTRGAAIEKRAKAVLEADGYVVDRRPKVWSRLVEKGGRRFKIGGSQDALGCIDLLAIHAERRVRMVQATAKGNAAHRKRKVEAALAGVYLSDRPLARDHLDVEVWTWGRWGRAGHRVFAFKVETYRGGTGESAWSVTVRPS
jgi:hypothetical protein